MFIDAKKAHFNPECNEEVHIELPDEAERGPGVCGTSGCMDSDQRRMLGRTIMLTSLKLQGLTKERLDQ